MQLLKQVRKALRSWAWHFLVLGADRWRAYDSIDFKLLRYYNVNAAIQLRYEVEILNMLHNNYHDPQTGAHYYTTA